MLVLHHYPVKKQPTKSYVIVYLAMSANYVFMLNDIHWYKLGYQHPIITFYLNSRFKIIIIIISPDWGLMNGWFFCISLLNCIYSIDVKCEICERAVTQHSFLNKFLHKNYELTMEINNNCHTVKCVTAVTPSGHYGSCIKLSKCSLLGFIYKLYDSIYKMKRFALCVYSVNNCNSVKGRGR